MDAWCRTVPKGVICLWSGSAAAIPGGWALCNGSGGTPDLRDKFLVGAGSTYNPDDTGGAATHTHGFTTSGHTHNMQAGAVLGAGPNFLAVTTSSTDSGTTNAGSTLPPYYALCYIMKL